LRHFYSGHPWLSEDIKERGIDELIPIWNVMDLTPQGRGSWYASLEYGLKAHAGASGSRLRKRHQSANGALISE